jgi:hypothetical protein
MTSAMRRAGTGGAPGPFGGNKEDAAMTRNLSLAVPLAMILSACAPVEDETRSTTTAAVSEGEQCFFTRQIDGYAEAPDGPDGEERVYVTTGVNDRWLFETFANCPSLDFSQRIALDTSGLSSICTGDPATLLVPSAIPDQFDRCPVTLLGKVGDD